MTYVERKFLLRIKTNGYIGEDDKYWGNSARKILEGLQRQNLVERQIDPEDMDTPAIWVIKN